MTDLKLSVSEATISSLGVEWSKWCVSVFSTRADLPLLSQSHWARLNSRKEEALVVGQTKH